MASGPLVGGGGGGDGSREKQRWSESKVYTRKTHNKGPKPAPNPQPPPQPPSSQQTLATTTDDINSSLQQPPPSDHHRQTPAPPSRFDSSAASDDDASSLNRRQLDPPNHKFHTNLHLPNVQKKFVTISLTSRSHDQVRELRRKLTAELEQVRTLAKKLEAREFQLSGALAPAPASGYSLSQLSANDVGPLPSAKRAPANSEAASTTPALHRRQLSVSVLARVGTENSISEAVEKEKRTPKANQYYRNSEFVLGKEKFPPLDSHKKSKANGSNKQEYGMQAVDKKLYVQAFKTCGMLLTRLMKHKFAWVFNVPVDVKGLGLHDYYTIIKHPMDLGTVKSRLSKNCYKTPEEFAEDVRLTFRNAMTYNPKGQDVHFMAEQLSQIFDEQWPTVEAEYTRHAYSTSAKKAPPVDMRTLERSDSTAHPMAVDSKTKPVSHASHVGRMPALKKPKAKDPHKRDMTFDEKQKLSNNLQNLPPEKLDNVVQIIKKKNLSLSQHNDEIEVDIDSVDAETLWELDRFVTNYKKSLSKNKRKAELAILARVEVEHDMQGRIPDNMDAEVPKESRAVMGEKTLASSMPARGENKEDNNASGSSASSSSSSESGSSSTGSDSESSSAYGSDAGHSPRT